MSTSTKKKAGTRARANARGKAEASHIPAAHGAKRVVRYRFSDGDTGDIDVAELAITLDRQRKSLREALEIESAVLSHADYMRRNASSERARASAAERRQAKKLDTRDDEVRKTAAAERKNQVYGYIMRTAQAFPDLKIDAVRQIIRKKMG